MSDFVAFLKKQTPLCLGLPFHKQLISNNLYYKLAERSEADFNGRNMFEQQCPSASICVSECRGRPVPKYPELEPFIHKYNPTEGEWNGQPVWLIKVDTCQTCPFKASCTKLCPSMQSFDSRNKNREDLNLDMLAPMEALDDDWLEKLYYKDEEDGWVSKMEVTRDDIAWDCLSEAQRAAVVMILVQGKTFEQAAQARGVAAKNVHKAYESGMARLKEFGLARRALKADFSCKYAVEYYRGNLPMAEIAKIYGVSRPLVVLRLQEFKQKHGINT
jgi:transposase